MTEQPLMGLMQDDFPLNLQHVRRRMRDVHPRAEVVTLTGDDGAQSVRASFAEISARVDRLARALGRLGIEPGDRVGTFAWNNQRHFELYMAVPCVGAVLHTLNVRLFAEQLVYIVNHAEDRVIFVDDSLVPLLEQLAPQLPAVEHYILLGDPDPTQAGEPLQTTLPNVLHYEELLGDPEALGSGPRSGAGEGTKPEPEQFFEYPEIDERQAASLCYTSGTTGNPKGVLYSHRSVCLHATASLFVDNLGLSRRDRALVIVPMFHVNAWGLPYAAALAGADLLMPDRFLQAEPLARAIERERPTVAGCVPTIFADLLRYADAHEVDLSSLTHAVCGGSAVPRQLMKDFEERHGVRIFQGWGMTETSPVVTFCEPAEEAPGPDGVVRHDERYWDERALQGRPLPWTELRLVDDDGSEVPWDGESTGEIEVRGPWIAARYFDDPSGDREVRPWLAAHRRHRGDRRARLRADHRPLEGRDQVRRRVDLLGRARDRGDDPSRRDRGGGDRQARRALVRAPAVLRGAARGCADERRGARRAPDRTRREVVAAGRVRVRRGGSEDERRQVRQEGAARCARGGHAGRPRAGRGLTGFG